MGKKVKGSETSKKDYWQVNFPPALRIAAQNYCDKYRGTAHGGPSKLIVSLIQNWAREMAKTDPELFININLEEE